MSNIFQLFLLDAATPDIITNTQTLLGDATTWLLILVPSLATIMVIVFSLQKTTADDQAHTAELNKKIKATIISAVIAVAATGLVKLILGYYS